MVVHADAPRQPMELHNEPHATAQEAHCRFLQFPGLLEVRLDSRASESKSQHKLPVRFSPLDRVGEQFIRGARATVRIWDSDAGPSSEVTQPPQKNFTAGIHDPLG